MTSPERKVVVHRDSDDLVNAVSTRFFPEVASVLGRHATANIVFEGGRVFVRILEALNRSVHRDEIDWTRVHIWWGDERWVPAGSDERNDTKARRALLDHVAIPPENVHPFPSSTDGLDLDESAEVYARELAQHAESEGPLPRFDLVFLGVGPDGHTASLFPERSEILERERTTLPVRHSPKPPPERLTLTRWVLNTGANVWVALSGEDKASVLALALAGASYRQVPIAGIRGADGTTFFVDSAAAAEISENLIQE